MKSTLQAPRSLYGGCWLPGALPLTHVSATHLNKRPLPANIRSSFFLRYFPAVIFFRDFPGKSFFHTKCILFNTSVEAYSVYRQGGYTL